MIIQPAGVIACVILGIGIGIGYFLKRITAWQERPKTKGICPECRRKKTCDELLFGWRAMQPHRVRIFGKTCSGTGKIALIFCGTCQAEFSLKKPVEEACPPRVPPHENNGAICIGHRDVYTQFFPRAA